MGFLAAGTMRELIPPVYWQGDDHTPARLEAAERLLDQAARVQPDPGELHLERAYLFYGANVITSRR